MRGLILYFSATGNTTYAADLIKEELTERNIEADAIDIRFAENLDNNYDFYIFGCPTHVDMFPDFYKEKLLSALPEGNNKNTMIFSTQASDSSSGPYLLGKKLEKHNFNVISSFKIEMPNNFYVVMFKPYSNEDKERVTSACENLVSLKVSEFLKGEKKILKPSSVKAAVSLAGYKSVKLVLKYFAKLTLSIDYDRCINCHICEKNCPTGNIRIDEKRITFGSKCTACQSCMHICPKNAFLYRKMHFNQYKLRK